MRRVRVPVPLAVAAVAAGFALLLKERWECREAVACRCTEADLRVREEAAQKSWTLVNAILQYAPLPISYLDIDGVYVLVNDSYLSLLNAEREAVVGRKMKEILAPESYDQIAHYIEKVIAGESLQFPLEWVVPGTDKHQSFIKTCAPHRLPDGRVLGVISVLSDVTEMRQIERLLHAAKEAAESTSRSKGEFLANMSHEMRTPLAGVLGMLDLVLDGEVGDESRQLLLMAKKSGESLLRIISDVLDFSRGEAGMIRFERRDFNLRECIDTAVDVLRVQALEKGLDLKVDVAPTVPVIFEGDEGRLRQVLVNLIGNAVKFTTYGAVDILAGWKEESDREKMVEIQVCVRDTGIGIPPDKLESIFGMFTQADTSTKRKFGGTGLGLAVSRNIVEAFGGRIWAQSVEGEGSSFCFTIPVGGEGHFSIPPGRDHIPQV